jgi:hypothetical protein
MPFRHRPSSLLAPCGLHGSAAKMMALDAESKQ